MANFSLKYLNNTVVAFFDNIQAIRESLAKRDYSTDSNIPDGTIRWNSSSSKFEIWDAELSSWGDLTSKYIINADSVNGRSLPNTISVLLNNHNKTLHDSLGIDGGSLDGINSPNFVRRDVDDNIEGTLDFNPGSSPAVLWKSTVGEQMEFRVNTNYFGAGQEGYGVRVLDGNATNGNVDGGFFVEAHTSSDSQTTELLRVTNSAMQYKGVDVKTSTSPFLKVVETWRESDTSSSASTGHFFVSASHSISAGDLISIVANVTGEYDDDIYNHHFHDLLVNVTGANGATFDDQAGGSSTFAIVRSRLFVKEFDGTNFSQVGPPVGDNVTVTHECVVGGTYDITVQVSLNEISSSASTVGANLAAGHVLELYVTHLRP